MKHMNILQYVGILLLSSHLLRDTATVNFTLQTTTLETQHYSTKWMILVDPSSTIYSWI